MLRRTKLGATLGPASADTAVIRQLVQSGIDFCRINFSHARPADAEAMISAIRRVSIEAGRAVAIQQDLQGPRIRIGDMPEEGVALRAGQEFILCTQNVRGDAHRASVSYPALAGDVQPGDMILVDEGALHLRVVESDGESIRCQVEVGGELLPRKGLNLPTTHISLPALTEKDRADIQLGQQLGVDYVSLSFVRTDQDVHIARRFLAEIGSAVPLVAKIESREAVAHADAIIAVSDGILISRGDLGLEAGYPEVFHVQHRFIRQSLAAGRLVQVGGELLDTMIKNPGPTRSECVDVTNAVLQGVDGLLLSGETAAGRYPVPSVVMLERIVRRAEVALGYYAGSGDVAEVATETYRPARQAHLDGVDALLVEEGDGRAATALSSARPTCPIVVLADGPQARWLNTWWGVYPVPDLDTARRQGLIGPGANLLRVSRLG